MQGIRLERYSKAEVVILAPPRSKIMRQARHTTTAEPATRVTAPAPQRRGPASTEDGKRSRDRVLLAALDLITEVGIDRVRLAEIARRASMSSGQVMYYFTSKEHEPYSIRPLLRRGPNR